MTSPQPPNEGTPEADASADAAAPELVAEPGSAMEPEPAAQPQPKAEPEPDEVSPPESEPEHVVWPDDTAAEASTAAATDATGPTSEPDHVVWPDAPGAGDEAPKSGRPADIDQVSAMAEDVINRGAPWDPRTSWNIVLGEGIVAAIVGLIIIFKPLGGSSTTLQIVGLILLAGGLITSFQLWRQHLRPEIEQLASFRSGSSVTVGLVVIVATFVAPVTDAVVAALAVVVGIGFVIYGIAGIAASFVRQKLDVPLPLFTLVANAVLALAGLLLLAAGASGSESVDGIFNLLGVLLIASGLALAGWSYMLLQQDER